MVYRRVLLIDWIYLERVAAHREVPYFNVSFGAFYRFDNPEKENPFYKGCISDKTFMSELWIAPCFVLSSTKSEKGQTGTENLGNFSLTNFRQELWFHREFSVSSSKTETVHCDNLILSFRDKIWQLRLRPSSPPKSCWIYFP